MPNPASWQKTTDQYNRRDRAKKKAKGLTEKGIEQAIVQAFSLSHRIKLEKMDAGGASVQKGVRMAPKSLLAALGLPQALPFGLEAWVGIPPGFPDLMAVVGENRFLFIEVKKPGGTFREGQKAFLEARRQEGHIAFHARSVDEALEKFQGQITLEAAS